MGSAPSSEQSSDLANPLLSGNSSYISMYCRDRIFDTSFAGRGGNEEDNENWAVGFCEAWTSGKPLITVATAGDRDCENVGTVPCGSNPTLESRGILAMLAGGGMLDVAELLGFEQTVWTIREREWIERKKEVGRGRRVEKVDLETEENDLCYASECSMRLVHKSKCCNGMEVHTCVHSVYTCVMATFSYSTAQLSSSLMLDA